MPETDANLLAKVMDALWRNPNRVRAFHRGGAAWIRDLANDIGIETGRVRSLAREIGREELRKLVESIPAGQAPIVELSEISIGPMTNTCGSCLHGTGTCGSCLHGTGTCGSCVCIGEPEEMYAAVV